MKLREIVGDKKAARDFAVGYRSGIRSDSDTYHSLIDRAVKNPSRLLLPMQRGYDVGVAVKILKDASRVFGHGTKTERTVDSFNNAQSLLRQSGNLYTSHVVGKLFDNVMTNLAESGKYEDAISLRKSLVGSSENHDRGDTPTYVRR